ncbi:MAG: hypothetical protein J6V36_01970, partial [Clostridia bacterium]|nr:hypothetical protein [Clostridia bacterium]
MKNVKKSISFVLFFLCLFSVFSIKVNGESQTLTISDDFKNVYLSSEKYIKINGVHLEQTYPIKIDADFKPLEEQKENIKNLVIHSNKNETILRITFYFSSGDEVTSYYLHHLHEDNYNFALNNETLKINFYYSDEPFLIKRDELRKEVNAGEKVVLNNNIYADEYYEIYSKRGDITIIVGFLIVDENFDYYYTDCEIAGKYSPQEIYYNSEEIPAIKLNESEFLSKIKEENKTRNKSYEFSDKFTSVIILSISFLFLPLAT